ncbi:methyltransferase domain-containing protein [Nordella sp. HKS 07]|uniref:class I SAM-dependent methyltransferase n=1 Tax=Nordella sp. HKS 07 TaxID=2712222 RepID=UPI0013E173CB|nr:class I SAM-dependent methyltransferase [Nordella sp. HKS 07]QIG51349.1 methyltransferase domain-containing protein [Nordella sp. HKS 07]
MGIDETFERYYTRTFEEHGPSPRGVDWHDSESLSFHYDKILAVIDQPFVGRKVSVLDVGCGYGGLLSHARESNIDLEYTGLDLVQAMIDHGNSNYPGATFVRSDIFAFQPERSFDYVLANGVLTEKLDLSIREFGAFSRRVIRRMYELAEHGIAFNMMTSHVNFTATNLYYQNPAEMVSFCATELSPKWIIDHAYDYFDFTMYVYKNPTSQRSRK